MIKMYLGWRSVIHQSATVFSSQMFDCWNRNLSSETKDGVAIQSGSAEFECEHDDFPSSRGLSYSS